MQNKKFGKLLVLEKDHKNNYGHWFWKCKCDCGNEHIVEGKYLRNGNIKSCGCLRQEKMKKELENKKFGSLTAIKFVERKNHRSWWLCKCDCGNEIIISRNSLYSKKNCGKCYLKKLVGTKIGDLVIIGYERKNKIRNLIMKCICGKQFKIQYKKDLTKVKKHCGCKNITNDPLYTIWAGIKARCYNKNNNNYINYGDRGIKVCNRWLNSFKNFVNDMGNRPSNTSIDRINNNGNYEPSNCRWATNLEQANNKRKHQDIINDLIQKAYKLGLDKKSLNIMYKSKL